MKLIKLALLFGLMILFAIACNKPAGQNLNSAPNATPAFAPATPDEFAGTRAIFAKDCLNCHGQTAQGGTVTVDGHKLKVPNLCEGHALHHPDSDFVEQITKGGDGMPAFKDKLKPDEVDALVRFIRHEFQGGMTPPTEHMKPMKDMPH